MVHSDGKAQVTPLNRAQGWLCAGRHPPPHCCTTALSSSKVILKCSDFSLLLLGVKEFCDSRRKQDWPLFSLLFFFFFLKGNIWSFYAQNEGAGGNLCRDGTCYVPVVMHLPSQKHTPTGQDAAVLPQVLSSRRWWVGWKCPAGEGPVGGGHT